MRREVLDKVEKARQNLTLKKDNNTQLIANRKQLDESVKKLVS